MFNRPSLNTSEFKNSGEYPNALLSGQAGGVAPPRESWSCSLYEYYWDGPKRFNFPVWQPRQTTLFVVFDGESSRLFSRARILLYYSKSSLNDARSNVWDIQPLGSVTHSFKGGVQHAPPNATTLGKLTIAFEVVVGQTSASKPPFGVLVLRSPESTQELPRDSVSILLERELSLTSETSSLSLSFAHSTLLCTLVPSRGAEQHTVPVNSVAQIELVTTRIVRVLPPDPTRLRTTNGCLPTELLIKTFEDAEFHSSWHLDLLSFAQVCRAWSCAMHVLHSRLNISDDSGENSWSRSRVLLDTYALATVLNRKPILGRAFHRLSANDLRQSERDWFGDFRRPPLWDQVRFTAALGAILRATKNLQYLHLGQLDQLDPDPRRASTLFTALQELHDLQTFSIGPAEEAEVDEWPARFQCRWADDGRSSGFGFDPAGGSERYKDKVCTLSVAQLARCMARWPALKSLKVHHLYAGCVPTALSIWRLRWVLRPAPACALTQLVLCRSYISDQDLVHLFGGAGSSKNFNKGDANTPVNAKSKTSMSTLERVVLDRVGGVTNAGLAAFLLAVSTSLASLTVRDVALPPPRQRGNLVLVGVRGGAIGTINDRRGALRGVSCRTNPSNDSVISGRPNRTIALSSGYTGGRHKHHSERALDAVLDKLPCLRELRIVGDVASELMLDRRSKMFLASRGNRASSSSLEEEEDQVKGEEGEEGVRVPVVRLWIEDVPRLREFSADDKWPGWCTPNKVRTH